jgi:hypothetical protein
VKKIYHSILLSAIGVLFLFNTTAYPCDLGRGSLRIPGGQKSTFGRISTAQRNKAIISSARLPKLLLIYGPAAIYTFFMGNVLLGESLTGTSWQTLTNPNPIVSEIRSSQEYDFSPAQIVASIGGQGFSDTEIIESLEYPKTVHTCTNLEEPNGRKIIKWDWIKSGDSFTTARWDNGSETVDLSLNREDMVLRFIVFGTQEAVYKVILEDNTGQKIEFVSTESLITTRGKQYSLMRLDVLSGRNPSFNWGAVKPVRFVSVFPANAYLIIKDINILNVKNVRDKGIGIGMFYSDDQVPGSNFPALGGYAGMTGDRPPASILSFSSVLERDVDWMTESWNNLLPGQVPHEILEFWLPEEELELGKAMPQDASASFRKAAEALKIKIISGEKITGGWNNVLNRISQGECDDILIKRAEAAAKYGKPVILRILHEPTGQWYPWSFSNQPEADDYIAAWKHVVNIYRNNGAANVVFAFSPHNYEPDGLQQTRKYQLIDYALYHLQEYINLIGVDAYSYPPEGGNMNSLAAGLLDLASKYQIPMIMGETSSAMPDADKRDFWNFLETDCKNGMFPFVGIGIFSIEKWENGSMKNFHPPVDIMTEWERSGFFAANPFVALKGGERDKVEGLTEPGLPWLDNSRLIADWLYSGGNEQQFTLLTGSMEEWAWKKVSGGWYGWGAGINIEDGASLNNNTISNYEFILPLEILEGDFNLALEDNQGQPTGKEIRLKKSVLLQYIVDGRLVIPLAKIVQYGTGDIPSFNWGNIRQLKIEAISDEGKSIFGRSEIRKTNGDTGVISENPDKIIHQSAEKSIELDQNYPNPFGAAGTTISYRINTSADDARIEIFNATGRLVKTLGRVDGTKGSHIIKWNGLDNFNKPAASGIYIIRITVKGGASKSIKTIKLNNMGITGAINKTDL